MDIGSRILLGPEMEDANTFTRSCDYCRAMKIRCTRMSPSCQRCSKKGIACTRNNPFHKRGPKPKLQDLEHNDTSTSARRHFRTKTSPTHSLAKSPPSIRPFILNPSVKASIWDDGTSDWDWIEYYNYHGLFESLPVISPHLVINGLHKCSPSEPLLGLLESMNWLAKAHYLLGNEKFHSEWLLYLAELDLDYYCSNSPLSSSLPSSPALSTQPTPLHTPDLDDELFLRAAQLLLRFAQSLRLSK